MLRALIWDVDGTLAETERDGHRLAFNAAFEAYGLTWQWDVATYGRLLQITGGRERILHYMSLRGDAPASPEDRATLAAGLHARKNDVYAQMIAFGRIDARPGVLRLIDAARAAGLRQAIATTTSRGNVHALLSSWYGAGWAGQFDAVVCGEDVEFKKPHPQVYLQALEQLGLPASEAVALEDSVLGLRAARAAGLQVVLTPSIYFPLDHSDEALLLCHDLDHAPPDLVGSPDAPLDLARLQQLHERRAGRSSR